MMELRYWTYEELPEFGETVAGATLLSTTGNEAGVTYLPNVTYAVINGRQLHLQILLPNSRNCPANHPTQELPETQADFPSPPFPIFNEAKYPCIVYVQGSAWMEQDVFHNIPMISGLAKHGYVVAIVEYRHSGIAPFPAPVEDARNAVRFLRSHAKEYMIDPEHIVLAGDSSGGHTALYAAIFHDDDSISNLFPGISGEIKGVVAFYAASNFMFEDSNPSTINHLLPDSPEGMEMGRINLRERPDLCRKLTVECNITENTDFVPTLLFHGTKDRTVNCRCSVSLFRHLKRVKKDTQLYLLQGADHGGPEFWTEEILSIVDQFVQRCLIET